MNGDPLEFEVGDGVARLTLDRPDQANAIDLPLARCLLRRVIECDANPAVRVVVLQARGRLFCAGGDLQAMDRAGDSVSALLSEITANLHAALARLARMQAPLLTVIQGPAAGAGLSLAAAGDLVLAARSAHFTLAYTAAGLAPDGSSTWMLPRVIGLRRTQELMLTNRRLSAEEAQDWGLVTRVVADEDLAAEAGRMAQDLARGPTRAYGAVKRLLLDSYGNSLETQMELESRAIAAAAATADGRAGIAAFLARRQPRFSGR